MNIYEKAGEYYARGWWSLDALKALARKGKLTGAQVAAIVGAETLEAGAVDLESMTKHELYVYAKERGITVYESWTKAEIVAAIEGSE